MARVGWGGGFVAGGDYSALVAASEGGDWWDEWMAFEKEGCILGRVVYDVEGYAF